MNIFELNFYQDKNNWKHNLIPIEIRKNESDEVIGLSIYKNYYTLNKKLSVFLDDHNKNFICRRCLNSYTSEHLLMNHTEKFGGYDFFTIRISSDCDIYWINLFHKNPLFLWITADFEADNEIDNSNIGNKTTNFQKQNPLLNGYHIISELEDVLKSGN